MLIKYNSVTKSFSISEPVLDKYKSNKDYHVIYRFNKSGKVKSSKVSAKTEGEATMQLRSKLAKSSPDRKMKDGYPGMIRAFESPQKDAIAQQYGQKLTDMQLKLNPQQ